MEQQPRDEATFTVKAGLAEMLKGGVIMDVVTSEEAKIAEDAGAVAVMALERVPADIRRDGGVARMSDPAMVRSIQEAVTIPVMAKARIGHFVEAQVLEALEVDYVDESEVLTPADEANHIDKWAFNVPFVCGATNLGEALRRIGEGAAMIRSKGEAGTGDVVQAVRHLRTIGREIKRLTTLEPAELATAAKDLAAPLHQIEVHLQPEKESFRQAKIAGKPQIGIGGDIPLAEHDFVDAAGRDVNRACQCVLAETHRLEELFEQDFAGMRISEQPASRRDSRRFRHVTVLLHPK